MEFAEVMVPIQDVLKSDGGYLIRPYVPLRSQRDGFMWQKYNRRGLWRPFMNSGSTKFTKSMTGP